MPLPTNSRPDPTPNPTHVPPPAHPRRADLPHALTFFLTIAQRRRVLTALRRLHPTREQALLNALHLEPPPAANRPRASGRRT